jgi:hypothetical protein
LVPLSSGETSGASLIVLETLTAPIVTALAEDTATAIISAAAKPTSASLLSMQRAPFVPRS